MIRSPGWRLWLIMLSIVLLSSITSVYVSLRLAEHAVVQQKEHDRTNREEQRAIACNLVSRILAGYEESPPPSATGKSLVEAWREEYRALGCTPTK